MCKLNLPKSPNVLVLNAKCNNEQWRGKDNKSRLIQFERNAWFNAVCITLLLTFNELKWPESVLVFCYFWLGKSPMTHRHWKSNNCFSQLQICGALTCEMTAAKKGWWGEGWWILKGLCCSHRDDKGSGHQDFHKLDSQKWVNLGRIQEGQKKINHSLSYVKHRLMGSNGGKG